MVKGQFSQINIGNSIITTNWTIALNIVNMAEFTVSDSHKSANDSGHCSQSKNEQTKRFSKFNQHPTNSQCLKRKRTDEHNIQLDALDQKTKKIRYNTETVKHVPPAISAEDNAPKSDSNECELIDPAIPNNKTIKKISNVQKCIISIIEKINKKILINETRRKQVSHSRNKHQHQILDEIANEFVSLKEIVLKLPSENVQLIEFYKLYKTICNGMILYKKNLNFLDTELEYLFDFYHRLELLTKLYLKYCPNENGHAFYDKICSSFADLKKYMKERTEKNAKPSKTQTEIGSKIAKNSLSMYANNAPNNNRLKNAKATSKHLQSESKIKPIERPPLALQRSKQFIQNKSKIAKKPAGLQIKENQDPNDNEIVVPATKDDQPYFSERHLKFLQTNFVTKKDLCNLLQTIGVALASRNVKQQPKTDSPVFNKDKFEKTSECHAATKCYNSNGRNVEKSYQYAKNVQLIEIIADDGTISPRNFNYEQLNQDLKQVLHTRQAYLKKEAENPLYGNEQFAEPWKIVTSIGDLIFGDQIRMVYDNINDN